MILLLINNWIKTSDTLLDNDVANIDLKLFENNGKVIVLDTKYKPIDQLHKVRENKKLGVSDADIKQMAIYASKRNAEKLYLLYPLWNKEEIEDIEIRYDIDVSENGLRKIPLYIVKIPFLFEENPRFTLDVLKKELNKTIKNL